MHGKRAEAFKVIVRAFLEIPRKRGRERDLLQYGNHAPDREGDEPRVDGDMSVSGRGGAEPQAPFLDIWVNCLFSMLATFQETINWPLWDPVAQSF